MRKATPYCIAKAPSPKARKSKGWEEDFQIGFLHRDSLARRRTTSATISPPAFAIPSYPGGAGISARIDVVRILAVRISAAHQQLGKLIRQVEDIRRDACERGLR
jgi:hypothetical protein